MQSHKNWIVNFWVRGGAMMPRGFPWTGAWSRGKNEKIEISFYQNICHRHIHWHVNLYITSIFAKINWRKVVQIQVFGAWRYLPLSGASIAPPQNFKITQTESIFNLYHEIICCRNVFIQFKGIKTVWCLTHTHGHGAWSRTRDDAPRSTGSCWANP